MKILHILGKDIREGNGISSAVPPLIEAQNKIGEVESRALILANSSNKKNKFKFDLHYMTNIKDLKRYILYEINPDIIIFHEVYYIRYIQAYRLIQKLDIPYIIMPHGSLTKTAQLKSKYKKILANKTLFDKFIENSKCIVFLNKEEQFKSIHNNKFIISGNGANSIKISKQLIEKKSSEKLKIIYLSRIDFYYKGIDFLLNALNKIEEYIFEELNFEVDIYGVGDDKEINKLNELILNNPYVNFKGSVYGKEKERVLTESNILVLTSRQEGMPMVILEAFSYGNPCIVTPGTNMSEVVKQYNLGWVCELEESSIKNNIIKAVTDYRQDKYKYIHNCIKTIEDLYDWNLIAQRSIVNYKNIILKKR